MVSVTICTDEGKLHQVLINLLSNAVKFTELGGVTLTVTVLQTEVETFLQFEVEDTGRGIDQRKSIACLSLLSRRQAERKLKKVRVWD